MRWNEELNTKCFNLEFSTVYLNKKNTWLPCGILSHLDNFPCPVRNPWSLRFCFKKSFSFPVKRWKHQQIAAQMFICIIEAMQKYLGILNEINVNCIWLSKQLFRIYYEKWKIYNYLNTCTLILIQRWIKVNKMSFCI